MRFVLALLAVGVTIYALVDALRAEPGEVRGLPKPLWVVVLVLVPLFGGLAWLTFGRPGAGPGRTPPGGLRIVAPDDDPDFLDSLGGPSSRPAPRPAPRPADDEEPGGERAAG